MRGARLRVLLPGSAPRRHGPHDYATFDTTEIRAMNYMMLSHELSKSPGRYRKPTCRDLSLPARGSVGRPGLATNALAQDDTREVGLDQVITGGTGQTTWS